MVRYSYEQMCEMTEEERLAAFQTAFTQIQDEHAELCQDILNVLSDYLPWFANTEGIQTLMTQYAEIK